MVSSTFSWIVFGVLSAVPCVHGVRRDLDVYNGAVIPDTDRWDYRELGPNKWPILFPFQCAGMYQSPIDIRTYKTVYNPYLRAFTFSTPTPGSKFVVHNNGHSIQVNTKGDFYLYGGGLGNVYKTEQFHFHWGDNSQHGAEHRINGVAYPMEMHIVSWNVDKYVSIEEASKYSDGIAVLGLLFEVSMYDNPVLEPIVQAIPHVRDPDWHNHVDMAAISIRNFVPRAINRFFRYRGSFTTPICLESVAWTMYEQKLTISERQLNVFRQALTSAHHLYRGSLQHWHGQHGHSDVREPLVNNFRPVQALNGRTVYRSFPFLPKKLFW